MGDDFVALIPLLVLKGYGDGLSSGKVGIGVVDDSITVPELNVPDTQYLGSTLA